MRCPTLRKGGPQNLIYKPVKARLSRAKKRKTGGTMLRFFLFTTQFIFLQGWEFAHFLIVHLLICLDCSDQMSDCERINQVAQCSCQKSDHERIAQVAHDKRATLRNLLSSLMIKEQIRESFVFLAKGSFTLFLTKKGDSLKKI